MAILAASISYGDFIAAALGTTVKTSPLGRTNRFANSYDISFESIFEMYRGP